MSDDEMIIYSLSSPVRGKSSVTPHKAEGRHGEKYGDNDV